MKTKTYVITGATSGIGKALVACLCKDNIVFAGYRNENLLDGLICQAEQAGCTTPSSIYPFYIDYAKPETIKAAADYIKSKCTKIDTLINVAGCVVAGPIEKIEMDEIRRQFEVNVFGHLDFSKNLLEQLQDGRIINVSSMSSFGFFPFISPYCASKRALDIFFNALLIENKKNIKVVSIKPGVIATPLWGKSVRENSRYIEKCQGYEEEMQFMISNAQKNELKGLPVDRVVKAILKADRVKNPKPSYTVGRDAFCANLISKLPVCVVNNLIRLGLKIRIKKRPCIK